MIWSTLAMLGSVFVSRNKQDNETVIHIAPIILLAFMFVTIGCSISEGELFSQCIQNVGTSVKEVFSG
jgi:hypothetical protein